MLACNGLKRPKWGKNDDVQSNEHGGFSVLLPPRRRHDRPWRKPRSVRTQRSSQARLPDVPIASQRRLSLHRSLVRPRDTLHKPGRASRPEPHSCPYRAMSSPQYTVVPDEAAFAVEILHPKGALQRTAGFPTEEAAQAWIADKLAAEGSIRPACAEAPRPRSFPVRGRSPRRERCGPSADRVCAAGR